MRYQTSTIAGILLLASLPVFGQRGSFRANIRGNGNSENGKCTVEVRIDQAAEVEFGGDTGRLRTLAGAPAQWTRIDCSAPMPRNMRDFHFKGIDGRGSQTLVADPRGNGGVAVVRLEDPKNGMEGYTFDLEWTGGSNNSNDSYSGGGGGYGYGSGYGRDRDRDGRNRDRDRNRNSGYNTINCASDDGRRRYCDADTRGGVRLLRQYGESCRQGDTWGYDDRGIWVDRNCSGEFQIGR